MLKKSSIYRFGELQYYKIIVTNSLLCLFKVGQGFFLRTITQHFRITFSLYLSITGCALYYLCMSMALAHWPTLDKFMLDWQSSCTVIDHALEAFKIIFISVISLTMICKLWNTLLHMFNTLAQATCQRWDNGMMRSFQFIYTM